VQSAGRPRKDTTLIRLVGFLILLSSVCFGAEPIKVVVLDTGFKYNKNYNIPLCNNYHYDATQEFSYPSAVPPIDRHGHGTHIVGLIHQFAQDLPLTKLLPVRTNGENLKKIKDIKGKGYCFVIVKYYNDSTEIKTSYWIKSLKYIETIPGKMLINISGGGTERYNFESNFVKTMLAKNNRIIAAIGNENEKGSDYYPALEPGVTAVGAIDVTSYKREKAILINTIFVDKKPVYIYKSRYSNYGHAKILWRFGGLYSGGLNDDIVYMNGTSQATAMETGLALKKLLKETK